METKIKLTALPPRALRYRSHYQIYFLILLSVSGLLLSFWGYKLSYSKWQALVEEWRHELWASGVFFAGFGAYYAFWLRSKLHRLVQVFEDHLCLQHGSAKLEIYYQDIASVGTVCWSLFYVKMKSGVKHYFNSSLERVDYIWDGLHEARPEIFPEGLHESFRLKLVQYDHHQKRKEWFFRHKVVDVFNWIGLPALFVLLAYVVQSQEVLIHQTGMYFFRLFMYCLLVLLITTAFSSLALKKFVFDRRIRFQMVQQPMDKVRDVEFEGIVLQRSKMIQTMTIALVFGLIIKSQFNLYSFTKVRTDLSSFQLKSGQTHLVDNRYNCISCKYQLRDGDVVLFGRGTVGQIMAKEGDTVGEVSQDASGRMIASENLQEVPQGHVALKLPGSNDIVMVRVQELIGKIQK